MRLLVPKTLSDVLNGAPDVYCSLCSAVYGVRVAQRAPLRALWAVLCRLV